MRLCCEGKEARPSSSHLGACTGTIEHEHESTAANVHVCSKSVAYHWRAQSMQMLSCLSHAQGLPTSRPNLLSSPDAGGLETLHTYEKEAKEWPKEGPGNNSQLCFFGRPSRAERDLQRRTAVRLFQSRSEIWASHISFNRQGIRGQVCGYAAIFLRHSSGYIPLPNYRSTLDYAHGLL